MLKKQYVIFAIVFLVSKLTLSQRDTIFINTDWQFAIDKKSEGQNDKWYENTLSNSKTVSIPHTWNIEDDNQNHYGWGWYQKKINIPASWKNKNIALQFGAINHTSHIYINGKKVAENIGDGFNKFYVRLSGNLNYGKENVITVACNNDYGKDKVPFGSSFDWPNDGGIIRQVALIVSDRPSIAYLHATPSLNVEAGSGKLKIKIGRCV